MSKVPHWEKQGRSLGYTLGANRLGGISPQFERGRVVAYNWHGRGPAGHIARGRCRELAVARLMVEQHWLGLTVLPRDERGATSTGATWGSPLWVLARKGEDELWWWTSGPAYEGTITGTVHRPGALMLAPGAEDQWRAHRYDHRTIHEGGRCTLALLRKYALTIESFFDLPGLAAHLHPRRTVLIHQAEFKCLSTSPSREPSRS
jgi:hypothetical protein